MSGIKRKDFTHHDVWFYVIPKKAPNWRGSRSAVHVPTKLMEHEWFYHYIQKTDKLYKISNKDEDKFRVWYNGRYHIDKDYLTEIEITPQWREEINKYERQLSF